MDFSGQGGVKPRVARVTPMRQNGGDEAGSGLLLWADGGRTAGSLSAGRARVHGRGGNGPVVRPTGCLLQSTRGRRQSLYPAPGNIDAGRILAPGIVPATAAPALMWEVARLQSLIIRPLWLTERAPSIFVRQHERHHRLAVIARSRDRFQRHQAHPLWPTPGGRVDSLVWPQGRISNDAVEVEQQVARVNASGRDCPLDGGMKHPDHVPEPAFQTLVWWQGCLVVYWPYVAMKCGSSHRKRPLQKLAAHLAHRCLLTIDQNAVVYRLLSGICGDVSYVVNVHQRLLSTSEALLVHHIKWALPFSSKSHVTRSDLSVSPRATWLSVTASAGNSLGADHLATSSCGSYRSPGHRQQ